MTDPLERIPQHHPQTASRIYSGEAVVITPAENMVRMLNPSGSRIWQLADGTRSVGEIAATLVAEYDVTPERAERATLELLNTLSDKGLISWSQTE